MTDTMIPSPDQSLSDVEKALALPFDPSEVKWKPAVVSGNRAMALCYVDARVIQDRLDEVLGVTGWQDDYEVLADNSVVCRLRLKLDGEWITKVDVGGPSEQPDGGDRMKAAFSDGLKRAAVKFGVGRYLYRLPSQWVDYDPQKRQFARLPTLPDWARPTKAQGAAKPTPAPAPASTPAAKPEQKQPAKPQANPAAAAPSIPKDGTELKRRLTDYDARLATEGLIEKGELVNHVSMALVNKGEVSDWSKWGEKAIRAAIDEVKWFEGKRRDSKAKAAAKAG